MTNRLAYTGTAILLVAPYLIHIKIGILLLIIGIALISPQVYKAKQYNLLLLNLSSIIGYTLQLLNII